MKELCIAHRMCPKLATEAVGFRNKTDMLKANAISIYNSIKNIETKIYLIFDNCNEKQINTVKNVFTPSKNLEVEYVFTDNIGNGKTFTLQVELLKKESNKFKYLYFSEDDYLYKEFAFEAMMDFLKNDDVDFVSPLDHPDRYTHIIPEKIKTELRISKFCHWRKAETTCCTFMTKNYIFEKTKRNFLLYRTTDDGSMWQSITKDAVLSPKLMAKSIAVYLSEISHGRTIRKYDTRFYPLKTILYYKWRIFGFKKYTLWNSVPTLAVHLCKPSIPPFSKSIPDYKKLKKITVFQNQGNIKPSMIK